MVRSAVPTGRIAFYPLNGGPGVSGSKCAAATELEESCTTCRGGSRARVSHLVTTPNKEGYDAPYNDRPRVVRAVLASR